MTSDAALGWMVLAGVGAPAGLLALLGGASLLNRPLPERWTAFFASGAMTLAFVSLTAGLVVASAAGADATLLSLGAWSTSHEGGIAIEFHVDRLSLAFAALTTAIAGVVSAFSNRYLHKEPGYHRYFVLLALFVTGMLLVSLAGNVEVLFIGWELVGLSSALLVAFFHERPAAVENALRVFSVYRISDAAMLSAAVLLHHAAGTASLSLLFGGTPAPGVALGGTDATVIAILLIIAVAGKSALLPFSGWLPRAMEGPTPSSAVYYGSLSIHAGCFLLLKSAPLLEQAPIARLLAGALGAATALFAGMTTRVQSDVKSSLAYASLTQVGIIVVEIAAGWYAIAFVHLAGHACFRLLQFLSAPNVLHDLHGIEAAMGDRRTAEASYLFRFRDRRSLFENAPEAAISTRTHERLFLFALERGFLDSILDRLVVEPFTRTARQLSRFDRWLCEAVLPAREPLGADGVDDRDE